MPHDVPGASQRVFPSYSQLAMGMHDAPKQSSSESHVVPLPSSQMRVRHGPYPPHCPSDVHDAAELRGLSVALSFSVFFLDDARGPDGYPRFVRKTVGRATMKWNNRVLVGAVTGILAAGSGCDKKDGAAPASAGSTPASAITGTAPGKHACKGLNSCKGQGGCKTDSHSCKGQNVCKGQGGCNMS